MISEKLAEFALANKRQFQHDRSQTVGASEVGQCIRKTFFMKNEDDPRMHIVRDPEYADRWGATMRGSVFENHFWEPAMRAAYGDRLLFAGPDQQTFVSDYLSATPDGLLIDEHGNATLVECKTADPRTKLNEPKAEHVYQVQVQMGLVAERTNYRPVRAIISYTDASFYDETKEFTVAYDHTVYEQAKERAALIMTAPGLEAVKPEGYIAGGKECEYCPFHTACGYARAAAVPSEAAALAPQQMSKLKTLALASKLAKRQADELEAEAREYEHEIKEILSASGSKKAGDSEISVSWASIKGRPSWDMKGLRAAAEAAGVDLAKFETVGDATDRLTITLRKAVQCAA